MSLSLNAEEQSILSGERGPILQKALRSVVLYGEAFGADCLLPVNSAPHFVGSFGAGVIQPYFDMIEALIQAGLHTNAPFTVDPRPMDYASLDPGLLNRAAFNLIYKKQAVYEAQLRRLGLKDDNAFSCACYLPQVGNTPRKGEILAWSESSAVVYANSVLGARSNRNSAGIDILCAVLGKAPRFGLLTDEGRQATWVVEVRTSQRPNPHLLGSAVGLKVMEEVPYLTGMEHWLDPSIDVDTQAYLKDMGAASASNGAVGLYHVAGVTPEACDQGIGLARQDAQRYIIDDAELERVRASYPVLWKNLNARPKLAFIGCPHLNLHQAHQWLERIEGALKAAGQSRLPVPLYLCSAPDVIAVLDKDAAFSARMKAVHARLTPICPLMYMNNPLCARQPILTNSNKLRTYSTARFFPDDELVQILASGIIPQGGR